MKEKKVIKLVCNKCKKKYDGSRITSKFCSNSCRTKFHLENKNKVQKSTAFSTKAKIDMIFNKVMELSSNIEVKTVTPLAFDGKKEEKITLEEKPMFYTPAKTEKTFFEFMNEISKLSFDEEYRQMAEEIEQSSLSRRQKDTLLLNMRTSKI